MSKPKGYSFEGEVRAVFTKTNGEKRLVCQLDGNGMLHIFSESQVVPRFVEVKNEERGKIVDNVHLCQSLNESAQKIFEKNKAKGFWDKERNVGELLMLVTSELGEAMEAHRKGRFADFDHPAENVKMGGDWVSNFNAYIKDTFEDEIADAVIRLLDLSAGLGIDLEKHINAKVRYNESRPKLHGKLY